MFKRKFLAKCFGQRNKNKTSEQNIRPQVVEQFDVPRFLDDYKKNYYFGASGNIYCVTECDGISDNISVIRKDNNYLEDCVLDEFRFDKKLRIIKSEVAQCLRDKVYKSNITIIDDERDYYFNVQKEDNTITSFYIDHNKISKWIEFYGEYSVFKSLELEIICNPRTEIKVSKGIENNFKREQFNTKINYSCGEYDFELSYIDNVDPWIDPFWDGKPYIEFSFVSKDHPDFEIYVKEALWIEEFIDSHRNFKRDCALIHLDNKSLFNLRVFYDDNKNAKLYIIDIEKANDCHYELEPVEFQKLEKVLKKKYKKRHIVDNLKQLIAEGKDELDSEFKLIDILKDKNIKFMLFSYGD